MNSDAFKPKIAIVGSGPAGLMAASCLASSPVDITIIEKRKSPGRKLLIAGSSGLNISNFSPFEEFLQAYKGGSGCSPEYWRQLFERYSVSDWTTFVEKLGFRTYRGSSRKVLLEDEKASLFLKSWVADLESKGVSWRFGEEVQSLDYLFQKYDAICLALGGPSYEPDSLPPAWIAAIQKLGMAFTPFEASNVGINIKWSPEFLKEAEGLPLKGIALKSPRGIKTGEVVITQYGLEGPPVYAVGTVGINSLDLKPEWTHEEILRRCLLEKENLSPLRRIQRRIPLSPGGLALLYHHTTATERSDLPTLASLIKNFPLSAWGKRPLSEAISAKGGVAMSEINFDHQSKRFKNLFFAGEMLDWDAPTGGYLIQACVSQGAAAGRGIRNYLQELSDSNNAAHRAIKDGLNFRFN